MRRVLVKRLLALTPDTRSFAATSACGIEADPDVELEGTPADVGMTVWWSDGRAVAYREQPVAEFLRALHPGSEGCLELRAFREGAPQHPRQFIPLPLSNAALQKVREFCRHNAALNLYHAIATRKDGSSGRLENCSRLHALYIEIDFKRGVPLREIWQRLHAFPLPPSVVAHSGGGLHVYWLLAEPLNLQNDLGVAQTYAWLGALQHRLGGEPESVDPARVLRIPATPNLKPQYGARAPIVTLLTYDWSRRYGLADVRRVLGDPETVEPAAQGGDPIDHGASVPERVSRARAYLASQAPAIEGGGGDARTFEVCCAVALGHDLAEDDSLLALRDWNARSTPPWSDRELRQKVRNAIRYGEEQRGARLVEFPTTEAGDAEFFAQAHGDHVRFDHRRRRWLLTDRESGIWTPDPTERLTGLVVQMMRERQRRAALITDAARKKALFNWALGGESRKRITNTLALAQGAPPIGDTGDTWDTDPWLLGAQNGVIDLRTGALRVAHPDDRITMRVRVAYDAAAPCPLWEKTIREIFADNGPLIAYAQRALGYSLTGDCREECLFFCWGDGANGKGTLMNTFAWIVGDYADNLSATALEQMQRNAGNATPELAKLPGKRFLTASEFGEASRLNEARIKALTGRDPITARPLYGAEFTFPLVAKIWLATNARPAVRDDSEGFWRRMQMIPFTQSFTGREDRQLKDRLRDEAPGILAWAVRGCLTWQREGLLPPAAVLTATKTYRDENDPLTPFIEARCVVTDRAHCRSLDLYRAYGAWGDAVGLKPWQMLSLTAFGKQMAKRFTKDDSGRHVLYVGIGIRESEVGGNTTTGEMGF